MQAVFYILQKETGSALVFFSLFLMLYREGLNPIILLLAVAAVVFFILTAIIAFVQLKITGRKEVEN